jgi:chromosomal replication initiator protein
MAGHPGRARGRGQGRGRGGQAASATATMPAADVMPIVEGSSLRAAVSERLGEAKFGLWFGDAVELRLSGDGEALDVRVPDEFFRDWIRRHYTGSLLEAAEAVAGRPLRLSIEVRDEGEPPLGDVVEPSPDGGSSEPEPRRRPTVKVPMPGNPKMPLSFPGMPPEAPAPPAGPSRLPRSDQPHPRDRMQAPHSSAGATTTAVPSAPRRPARRLEEFVAGPGSRLALAAAREMAQTAGTAFNPLVVHGGVGLGKTLLLEGIGHALRRAHPGLNVMQLTAESFTNSFLEAMRTGTLSSFRNRFRGAGALIVDDIHFLAAKKATQDEFLHTFNALFDKGAPIVLAADQHPRLITRLTDELVTRFLGGMVVKLEAPDQATRRAILQSRAMGRGVDVPEAVIAYIAEHLRASVRELEGALHTVIAQAVLTGKRLDLNLARAALRDTIRHTTQAVALRDVERAVCELFQVTPDALKSDGRARALAYPRMMAMYLARKHAGAAYSEIGRYFGGRNHSTVISAEKKVLGWLRDEERSSLLPGFETVADLLADLERSLGT